MPSSHSDILDACFHCIPSSFLFSGRDTKVPSQTEWFPCLHISFSAESFAATQNSTLVDYLHGLRQPDIKTMPFRQRRLCMIIWTDIRHNQIILDPDRSRGGEKNGASISFVYLSHLPAGNVLFFLRAQKLPCVLMGAGELSGLWNATFLYCFWQEELQQRNATETQDCDTGATHFCYLIRFSFCLLKLGNVSLFAFIKWTHFSGNNIYQIMVNDCIHNVCIKRWPQLVDYTSKDSYKLEWETIKAACFTG